MTIEIDRLVMSILENLLENERGPMNDQDLKKTDYDPDRSLVLSHFLTNFLQNLASCQTSLRHTSLLSWLAASEFFCGTHDT
jgi:hypothetical protein